MAAHQHPHDGVDHAVEDAAEKVPLELDIAAQTEQRVVVRTPAGTIAAMR
jgi:hypothetical protein